MMPSTRTRRTAPLVAAASWLVLGCAGAPAPAAIEVDDVVFSDEDVAGLPVEARQRLADLAAFGVAVSRGELARLGEPFVERERESILLRKLAAEIALRESGYDEARLRALYDDDAFPELVVRHIVILSERWRPEQERERARRRAAGALERVRAGEDFAQVAADVSEEPGAAERGGLLGPGRESSWVPEFWAAAAGLPEGGVSDVVETRYGFHVLKLEERRAVPYEDARPEFVRRFADRPEAAARAREWAARQQATVRVDTAAVERWTRTGGDTLTLAVWPAGEYTGRSYGRYLATLDAGSRVRLEAAPDAHLPVVAGAARNALLAGQARALGLALSEEEESAARRHFRLQAESWAGALGFAPGQRAGAIKEAALGALGSERQTVRLARIEIRSLAPLLRELYPVTVRGAGPGAAPGAATPEPGP